MLRYYFHIRSGHRVITDKTGKNASGLEAAHWHAVRLAYQVRRHLPNDDEWVIEIEDEAGHIPETFVPCFRRSSEARQYAFKKRLAGRIA